MIEPGNLDRQRLVPKAKEDDAAMREAATKDELAEVSVIRDADAVLSDGNSQHIFINEGGRVLVSNGRSVMTARSKMVAQRQVGALVEEEPLHAKA